MKKEFLILITPYNSFDRYVLEQIRNNELCDVEEDLFYDKTKKLLFIISLFICLKKIKKQKYRRVIVFDTYKLGELIHFFFPKQTCVFFWNTVPKVLHESILKTKMPIYTFDKNDAEYFSINYTDQFYFPPKTTKQKKEIDILFVGENKNRLDQLLDFYNVCKKYNLIVEMKIYDDALNNSEELDNLVIKEYIDYYEYSKLIMRSKALLEIPKEGQNGLTLRVLEAIFFDKKIITSNHNIVYRDFYRKDRVFIIGKDNYDELRDFLELPISKYTEDEKQNYSFDRWLDNFK